MSHLRTLSRVIEQITLTHFVNKAGYTATPVACRWAGAIFEVTGAFGQELKAKKLKNAEKSKV